MNLELAKRCFLMLSSLQWAGGCMDCVNTCPACYSSQYLGPKWIAGVHDTDCPLRALIEELDSIITGNSQVDPVVEAGAGSE